MCASVFRNKFSLINRYFDAPTNKKEQYDLSQEFYKIIKLCNEKEMQDKNKLPVTMTFNRSKFFKGLVIALVGSLVIFIALKFIFDVVAIWALIVFPVAPVIVFFVCVFFLRNKFKETTCLHKIEVPIPGDENQLNLQIDERNDRTANEPELVNQENNTFKKYDKEYPGN